jgi:hypothetical protein
LGSRPPSSWRRANSVRAGPVPHLWMRTERSFHRYRAQRGMLSLHWLGGRMIGHRAWLPSPPAGFTAAIGGQERNPRKVGCQGRQVLRPRSAHRGVPGPRCSGRERG